MEPFELGSGGTTLGGDQEQDAVFPFDFMIFTPALRHKIKIAETTNFSYQNVNKTHTSV